MIKEKIWLQIIGRLQFGVSKTPLHSTPPLHLLADAEIIDILEKIHVKFCKLLLNLKT
jgi:hypothetical protein